MAGTWSDSSGDSGDAVRMWAGGQSRDNRNRETGNRKTETEGQDQDEADRTAGEKPYEGTELNFWMQSYGNDPSNQTKAMDKVTADFF